VNRAAQQKTAAGLTAAVAWLTPRRLRVQAIVLAVCLWGVCAVDFATPAVFARAGNIKFQDFLPFYVSARLISQHRAGELYDQRVMENEIGAIVHPANRVEPAHVRLSNLYGPQVALLFVPLTRPPFQTAAWIWVSLSMAVFLGCVDLVWKCCVGLRSCAGIVAISAIAFPPLWHFFLRGQISVLALACFTAAFLAFRADRGLLAGIALGFLVFKPPFLIAIPLVLLLARAWKVLAGVVISASAQLAFAWTYFGSDVMRSYFDTLWHVSRWIGTAELELAPVQMHSLRSFWTLLIPRPEAAFVLYILTSFVAFAIAAAIWKSTSPLALRFSALTLAAVLVNPHLFVYDLLVLAPVLLLLVDWTLANSQHQFAAALQLLSYLAFILPLFGPLSRWTHLQLSVPVFAALLWILWQLSLSMGRNAPSPLASHETRDV
jgi:alpha-1,2-mannosyltransferase